MSVCGWGGWSEREWRPARRAGGRLPKSRAGLPRSPAERSETMIQGEWVQSERAAGRRRSGTECAQRTRVRPQAIHPAPDATLIELERLGRALDEGRDPPQSAARAVPMGDILGHARSGSQGSGDRPLVGTLAHHLLHETAHGVVVRLALTALRWAQQGRQGRLPLENDTLRGVSGEALSDARFPGIEFFQITGSSSFAVRCALEEIGAPYEAIDIAPRDRSHPPAFAAVNPWRSVPALRDGEAEVYEIGACLLYLAERFPEAPLAPPTGDPSRGSYLRWLVWLADTFRPLWE